MTTELATMEPVPAGPYAKWRAAAAKRIPESVAAYRLTTQEGMTVRAAAELLGLSVATTWRRARWWADWTTGDARESLYGLDLCDDETRAWVGEQAELLAEETGPPRSD